MPVKANDKRVGKHPGLRLESDITGITGIQRGFHQPCLAFARLPDLWKQEMHTSHNSALAANVYFSSNSDTTPQHNLQGPGLVTHGAAVK